MTDFFHNPVLVNPTRPYAGDDGYTLDTAPLMKRLASNTGNMVFLYALTKQIEGLKHYTEADRSRMDVAVWGCSNFIHNTRTVTRDHPTFAAFDAPYVAIGLGAQGLDYNHLYDIPDDTLNWYDHVVRRAPTANPNITLRGPYSQSIVARHGLQDKAVVMGCPSLFINTSTRLGDLLSKRFAREPDKVAVAPGNILALPRQLRDLERSLVRIADEYGGGYICQGPEETIAMARGDFEGVERDKVDRVNGNIKPWNGRDGFRKWFRRQARVFTSVPSWMEHLRSCDLVIGTRIHGTVLALQSGTPALCIAIDARQRELCEVMRIPWVWWQDVRGGITVGGARAILKSVDWHEFDRNRKEICGRYISFLESNRLKPTPLLTAIAEG